MHFRAVNGSKEYLQILSHKAQSFNVLIEAAVLRHVPLLKRQKFTPKPPILYQFCDMTIPNIFSDQDLMVLCITVFYIRYLLPSAFVVSEYQFISTTFCGSAYQWICRSTNAGSQKFLSYLSALSLLWFLDQRIKLCN